MGLTKRKRDRRLYGLHAFAQPGSFPSGPFRDNVRAFLRDCGEVVEDAKPSSPAWRTLLVSESSGAVVPLYAVEESVWGAESPFCDHCRCVGWSNHFVSKRRYHFIIPTDEKWSKSLDVGDGESSVQNHLLHGLIHCNGFGHLLCINGIEGGSKYLCGRELMDLWDRICAALRTRKITVEDTSTKSCMDVRLLYGVAYGHSWFGRWGYKFCRGSFGVSAQNYEAALAVLSSVNLDELINDFVDVGHGGKHIRQIIQVYRQMSGTQLITIRDLLQFLLSLKTKATKTVRAETVPPSGTRARWAPKPLTKVNKQRKSLGKDDQTRYENFSTFAQEMGSRWPARRLEYAAEVIVDALKEKPCGMSRQDLRDASRLHIGDTGLLDYVIKSINNHIVGEYVVKRTVNPSTRVLEFTVHHIGENSLEAEDEEESALDLSNTEAALSDVPTMDVYSDIEYLYHHVLENYPKPGLIDVATQVVLDSKHFVKEWPFEDEDDVLLRFECQILPTPEEIETWLTRPLGPCELIVLPPYATIGDLKLAAENAFRDTYFILENFIVREVEGMEYVDDGEVVFGSMESGSGIWLRGSGMDLENRLKYEGGDEAWTVHCTCGAVDDDGERMVACDMCEVWQHTRCIGIDDTKDVPPLFLCGDCSSRVMAPMMTQCGMDLGYCEY